MKALFLSTSIPYVNAAPHLGHAQEFALADAIARYARMKGRDVYFLSGTDDNALKNVRAARAAGIPVRRFVNERAAVFRRLAAELSVSNDDFIETSSDRRHAPGAEKLWRALRPGDVEKKAYAGRYCVGCEEFKTEKELDGGACHEHPGKELDDVREENYFFKLSRYGGELKKLIEGGAMEIIPETRKNETMRFIEGGLLDFSISRSRERARGWGVPVPGDDSQIMYVWVDALSNYINALGYADGAENFRRYWQDGETVHVIGKGINRFHAVYWPAMLLSAGVVPPKKIVIHGYITVGGQKMSKSTGNVVDPFGIIAEYGADALRYYLLREVPTFEDGDYTEEHFREAYNANLANGIGNLASRIMKMASDYLDKPVAADDEVFDEVVRGEYEHWMNRFEIEKAADVVWARIRELDNYIEETKPFKTVGADRNKATNDVVYLVAALGGVAHMLTPFLPDAAEKIKAAIAENKPPAPLFPRV